MREWGKTNRSRKDKRIPKDFIHTIVLHSVD